MQVESLHREDSAVTWQLVHKQYTGLLLVSHPLTSVAPLRTTSEAITVVSKRQVSEGLIHAKTPRAVLICVTELPLLDYTSAEGKHQRHTPVVCAAAAATHTRVGRILAAAAAATRTRASTVLRDMTLLEFITTSVCVHFSELHNVDGDEALREST